MNTTKVWMFLHGQSCYLSMRKCNWDVDSANTPAASHIAVFCVALTPAMSLCEI